MTETDDELRQAIIDILKEFDPQKSDIAATADGIIAVVGSFYEGFEDDA